MAFQLGSLPTGLLVLLTGLVPASAQLVPIDSKIRVDTPATAGFCPSLVGSPDGGFTVAWGTWQDESLYSCHPRGFLYSRPFNRNGVPEGQPSTVGRVGDDCVFDVRIGPPADNGTILTWSQWGGKYGSGSVGAKRSGSPEVFRLERGWLVPLQSGALAAIRPVYTARFGSLEVERRHDPLTKGRRFRITRTEGAFFSGADAAETADGGMVVTWLQEAPRRGAQVLARRFDAAGKPLGKTILVRPRQKARPSEAGGRPAAGGQGLRQRVEPGRRAVGAGLGREGAGRRRHLPAAAHERLDPRCAIRTALPSAPASNRRAAPAAP